MRRCIVGWVCVFLMVYLGIFGHIWAYPSMYECMGACLCILDFIKLGGC